MRAIVTMLALVCLSRCGGSPTQPPPPPPAGPTITCPPAVETQSERGDPVVIEFDQPQAGGGVAPVAVSCTFRSGAEFPVGVTTVVCTATDSLSRLAGCTFTVTVRAPPRLAHTRFVSFGDSITEGVLSPSINLLITSPPHSYPALLQTRLTLRYRLQTPAVLNEGIGGEKAYVGGIARFRSVLLAHRPDVVLVMEGTNDLLDLRFDQPVIIDALRAMIQEAKSQGVRVAIATIAPQRAGGLRGRDAVALTVPGFNDRIRELAASEDVPLVDVYNAMKDDVATLIGIDDLHPTERGYQVIAETFFEAIQRGFEQPPGTQLRAPR